MKDKSLKKLSRADLLELLVEQGKKTEELEKELSEAYDLLSNRELKLRRAGTMAEAAVRLNDVFESADSAAKQYVENIRRACLCKKKLIKKRDAESKAEAARIVAQARKEAELIIERAKEKH